ncbi:hypothetical protein TSAR_003080 [Trichomalopsis sarcophagae]|uniref:BTB domain-containing protein n=1 Tax=Trichomalopsis sarcophagae TaxID=543379 RepID=A0A232FFW9_9HYME|nr:hypothetical protein TSAR_003080 [Trichomalopsis sarcophagae]
MDASERKARKSRSSKSNKRQRTNSADDEETWCTWTPSALSLQHKKIGQALYSPVYHSNDSSDHLQWRILLFPRGCEHESRDYFSLFLELLTESRDYTVHANFAFYLRGNNSKELTHRLNSEHVFSVDDRTCGFTKYLRRSDMMNGFHSVLCHIRAKKVYCSDNSNSSSVVDDESTVYSLQQRDHIFITNSQLQDSRVKVATDLENAIDNDAFSDVELVAGGKVFNAHRVILATRSHVFASMLENDGKRIEFQDINELILKEMLRFIYTGSVSSVTGKLMVAANTYGLQDLHLLCQQELIKSICVQNAGNILMLADQAQGNQLKLDAMRFITHHANEVIKTAAYKRMVDSHLHLIEELYRFEHTPMDIPHHDQYHQDSEYQSSYFH